jgi:benzoate/toluate 1,2-dioxygenase reductase component
VERIGATDPLTAELIERRWLTPEILELRLRRPAAFNFLPGQFVSFLMRGYQRDYTMVSAPHDGTLDFCVAMVDEGRFCSEIIDAAIGTALRLSGPHGHFIFQGPLHPAVLVATGTGIAPFVAFCRNGLKDALLLHGVPTPGGLIYRQLLQSAYRAYVPCISRPPEGHACPDGTFVGRVTQYLEHELEPGIYDFYLCGLRTMVQEATVIIDERFAESRLFIEVYD